MGRAKTRGNGQGTAFKRGSGWTAQVTASVEKDDVGRIIRRRYKTKGGFKTKREALEYCKVLRGEPAGINQSITFAGLYGLWSDAHYARVSKDAENGYRAAYAKCGALATRVFAGIKAADLQAVIDGAMTLPKTKKDGTVVPPAPLSPRAKGDIKSLFSNMYKYAIENDYAEKNYAQFVKGPAKAKSKKDAFTAEERAKLWNAYESGNDFVGYILTMIYTGMRYGEISIVKKENVFIDKKYLVGGIKTKAGIDREIPLCDKILPVVEKLYNEGEKKLLEIAEKEWYTRYYVALEQSGVRGLNPHCCRHTTATALAEAGVAPAIIKSIMGHEDYATTLGYTHISLSDKLDGINKI